MRRFVVGLLVLLSAVSLLLSSTSLWTRRNVVNTEVFVANAETMVHQPAVQARITDQVATQVMANPDVQQAVDSAVAALPEGLRRFRSSIEDGVRSLVSKGVDRLLTSDAFTTVTTAALTSAHTQLVEGQPVQFTLGQAKARLPDSAQTGLAGQVLALIPNDIGITVVTPSDAPRLYNAIDLLKTLWLWTGLLALALLGAALAYSRRRRRTLRAWSVTLSVLILLLLATLRFTGGQLLVQVKPENRDAISEMWNVLAASLRSWNLWLLAIALFVLVETLVWGHLGLVAGVRRGAEAARAQLRRHHEAQVTGAATAAGAEAGAAGEAEPASWPRRLAASAGAFVDGLAVNEKVVRLGAVLRRHQGPAQWTGVGVGALILLFWPSPTLSVLIWIGALVALYLGLLHWVVDQAPAEETGATATAGSTVAPPAPRAAAGQGDGQVAVEPVAATTVPQPRAPEPGALSPEGLHTMSDRVDLLLRLGAARESGVLTDEEFAREKSRLLIP